MMHAGVLQSGRSSCSLHKSSLVKQPIGKLRPSRASARHNNKFILRAQTASSYQSPSSAPAATELQLLEEYTVVVPNTDLLASRRSDAPNRAATSSAGVIRGILRNPADLQQFKTAVERALVYDKCARLQGDSKTACQIDKALVNVASIFAKEVDGRVSTEVDPRTAFDKEAIVERGRNLGALLAELDVPKHKFLLRIPATWEGIQAAKVLEQEGLPTHIIMVYSFVQAAAAAQAGASVISPNVGRIGDFYQRNPGAIRNPRGPRQDAGALPGTSENPGIELVQRIYNYIQKYHKKSVVMASGVRTSQEAFELAGVDYMTVSASVLKSLQATATMQGYNDGLSGAGGDGSDSVERRLSPEGAASEEFSGHETETVTADSFRAGLDQAGLELLQQGVQGLVEGIERLIPDLDAQVFDAE